VNTALISSARKIISPVQRPQGCAGEAVFFVTICHHVCVTFDDRTTAALREFARACEALDAATDDAQVLDLSDRKSLAALNLRKALTEAGWTAPVRATASQ
jgi:hypothetical protein